MKNFVLQVCFLFLFLIIFSCHPKSDPNFDTIINGLKDAINNSSYKSLQPHLSNNLTIDDMSNHISFTQFYAYLCYPKPLNHKISTITYRVITYITSDSAIVRARITYIDKKIGKLKLVLIRKKGNWKIRKIEGNWCPPHYSFAVRSTYIEQEIFGDSPVDSIVNLKIIHLTGLDSVVTKNYRVYYEPCFVKEALIAGKLLERLDSVLLNNVGIKNIKRENVALITTTGSMSLVGNTSLPWPISLKKNDTTAVNTLLSSIGTTISHEIIENTLVYNLGMNNIALRWFREGISELIAFRYCQLISPIDANNYFLEGRLTRAKKFVKHGNLLDWRSEGPVADLDKGKLYGKGFIYGNQLGQYGRAFKFFYELVDSSDLSNIGRVVTHSGSTISNTQLIEKMNTVFKINTVERITGY